MTTVFMTRDRSMVTIHPQASGVGRIVCVWTWPEGPDPVQAPPFPVASVEAARELVPAGAVRVVDVPPEFAEEAWFYAGEQRA